MAAPHPSDHDLLIMLNERVEILLINQAKHREDHRLRCETLDSRLERLEEWKWKWVGAMMVLMGLLSVVSNLTIRKVMP